MGAFDFGLTQVVKIDIFNLGGEKLKTIKERTKEVIEKLAEESKISYMTKDEALKILEKVPSQAILGFKSASVAGAILSQIISLPDAAIARILKSNPHSIKNARARIFGPQKANRRRSMTAEELEPLVQKFAAIFKPIKEEARDYSLSERTVIYLFRVIMSIPREVAIPPDLLRKLFKKHDIL
jgi:hypothetical protein